MEFCNNSCCNCIGQFLPCGFTIVILGHRDTAAKDSVQLVCPDFGEGVFAVCIF